MLLLIHQFYQHIINYFVGLETLVTCCDGSFDPHKKTGSHGWVASNTDKLILAKGSGPADGHPSLMSSYRAELGGLIVILYMIYRICQYHQVTLGKIKYHCDNKGVITNVFSTKSTTITQYLHADYDSENSQNAGYFYTCNDCSWMGKGPLYRGK